MYQWYCGAQACYAYLADVHNGPDVKDSFQNSEWFKKGWTLQELLAPKIVVFFDHDWEEIGTKCGLEESITTITGIHDFVDYENACVAQKMSWAAERRTTRVEDRAYSLMGLFGVYMPPLYGEGENASMRLQLEILKVSDDESIFAWSTKTTAGGLLAWSPKAFQDSGSARPLKLGGLSLRW